MRAALSLLSFLLLLESVGPAPVPGGLVPVRSHALAVVDGEADAGRLRFRGALVLAAVDPRFGGLSSVRVAADGASLLAVTDCGDTLTASIERNDRREMVAVGSVVMARWMQGPSPARPTPKG